jgi:tetratricopeptide (TPR) repeat protein
MEPKNQIDLLELGARHFINDDFNSAVKAFTEFLNLNSGKDRVEGLLYRASANIKLGNYPEALKDLDEAGGISENSFEINYKKGIAYFKTENFVESSACFRKALSLATNTEQREKLVTWIGKVDIECEENNLNHTIEKTITPSVSEIKFIHNWYQTSSHVVLTLNSNTALNKDQFDFTVDRKLLIISDKQGNTLWEMQLSNGILPNQSEFEVNGNGKKVEYKLKKEVPDFNWVNVDVAKVKESQPNFKPSYPTSSKVKKDWDSLDKELTEQTKEDAKNDPNEGMMKLFRDIYERSDENTRRAMMKSFQTSGGTVLSTNWDEVKAKDYEGADRPEAPKGQEWRKHEP